ncbi:PREDICTED: uncharacterized protein LOC108976648 [Bactrocera latifrons]|uniref:uncharacterized protein LOC108976648 n=1 Tax=Bactrocera latifrons TaxID=174628 RepID=UPI0008DD8FC8|nr:PREDICTED: uncharacterized protein LOC108976648 [Bactrocera latifrons]
MSKTNDTILSISLLKNSIETILTNIKELERIKYDHGDWGIHVNRLKQHTEELIQKVESAPLEQLTKVLKKRKLKRQQKKYKLKQLKANAKNRITPQELKSERISNIQQSNKYPSNPSYVRDISTVKKCHHIRLLKQHDAQRFIQTFELLKKLHFSRGQNVHNTKEFGEQLRDLRIYWGKILDETNIECTQERHVEDQWNETIFGSVEHSCYDGEQKISDLLRIRRIWDSYLTRSKNGSSIPGGWILPNENANSEWQQYRVI